VPDLVTMLTMPPSARRIPLQTVVHDAEFLHGILRRRGALHTANRVDEVGAVYRDLIAERAHAAEGDLRDLELGEGRSQARFGWWRRWAQAEQSR
jgi:hypothetical protein